MLEVNPWLTLSQNILAISDLQARSLTFDRDFGYNLGMKSPGSERRVARIWQLLTVSLLAALAGSGCSQPAAPLVATTQMSAGITATMTTSDSPHTGDDTVVITLHDSDSGIPIGDANVTGVAEAQSPRLPGQSVTGRSQGNGVYDIPLNLPVISPYKIVVTAERPTHPTGTFTFSVDVPK